MLKVGKLVNKVEISQFVRKTTRRLLVKRRFRLVILYVLTHLDFSALQARTIVDVILSKIIGSRLTSKINNVCLISM